MNKINKNFFWILIILTLFSGVFFSNLSAEDLNKVDVFLFVSNTCPHCAELEKYLGTIEEEYDLNLNIFVVNNNKENQELFQEMASEYGISVNAVPTMFIDKYHFVGFAQYMKEDILSVIEEVRQIKNPNYDFTAEETNNTEVSKTPFKLPIIGNVDLSTISLPLLTIILGFLDGFNPCAFFVLLFLLSMLVYAKNKKRMLIIGLTFVFFSGLIYFLFMSAWLNFFMVTKSIAIITTIAGLVAIVIGIINIKDFFAFKKGVSLSISDKHRNNLIERMRGLLKAESLPSMLFGTIALAIAANMYELLCTAGFPMVFTKILVLNELNQLSYYLYLLFYNIIYVIPLLTIVLVLTFTLGEKKLTKSQGEALKLMSGMMMFCLGALLVFAPALLNNILVAIGIIVVALCLTGIILLLKKISKKKKEESNEI